MPADDLRAVVGERPGELGDRHRCAPRPGRRPGSSQHAGRDHHRADECLRSNHGGSPPRAGRPSHLAARHCMHVCILLNECIRNSTFARSPSQRSGKTRKETSCESLGTLDELPGDYVAALTAPNLVPLWPNLRALLPPQAPRTSTLPAHWSMEGDPAAAAARGRADADGKGRAARARPRQPGTRPRQPAGLGDDLSRRAACAAGRDRTQSSAYAQRRAHRRRGRRRSDARRRRSLRDGARRPDPHADRSVARAPARRAGARDLARRARPAAHGLSRRLVCRSKAPRRPPTRRSTPMARAGWRRSPTATARKAPTRCFATSGGARARRCRHTLPRCDPGTPVQLAYVNPETGGDCLNTLAFAALMVRAGRGDRAAASLGGARVPCRRGQGRCARVNDTAIAFEHADTFCAPGCATMRVANRSSRAPPTSSWPTSRRCSASSASTSSSDRARR